MADMKRRGFFGTIAAAIVGLAVFHKDGNNNA